MEEKKIRQIVKKLAPALAVFMLTCYIPAFSFAEDDIHEAAKQGDLAKIKALLEKDPSLINAKDKDGETPLFRAAEGGHLEIVQYLAAKGAQIDIKNNADQTPLFFAAYSGQAEVLNWLLSNGADLKGLDRYGRTPLYYASRGAWKEATEILVKKGLDIAQEDIFGFTPLKSAVTRGRAEIIAVFIALKALNPSENIGNQVLHEAAVQGHKDIVNLLIAKGANTGSKSDDGGTLLHNATMGGLWELAKQLIDEKAEVNAQNSDGRTPLHYAVREGNFEITKILVEKGAELNIKGRDGRTPLQIAEDWDHEEIIDFLLAKGAKKLKRAELKDPDRPWVGISYISNEGFLIESRAKKVLVDALHKNPYGYPSTPPKVYEMMRGARPPFDRIDLILISHAHSDHFNAEMAAAVLLSHPETVLVGNEITTQELEKAAGDNFSKISPQIKSINPEWGTIVEEKINGINLKIFAVNHAELPDEYVTLAYIMDLEGINVFHLGDSVPASNEKHFKAIQLPKEGLDIAFMDPFFLEDEIGKEIIKEHIQPKKIVPMHMRSSEIAGFTQRLKVLYPNLQVFKECLEKKLFEQESQ